MADLLFVSDLPFKHDNSLTSVQMWLIPILLSLLQLVPQNVKGGKIKDNFHTRQFTPTLTVRRS